ncbi:MAG: hypothetical protein LKF64_11610 [Alcaligenes faecalis]|jgi:hypothetical protein|uniref:hypothetical protein n=1 Tax=Alcaligenes aquatilis TaxID=323284 RepID=UPI0037518117|nr:hypothetical protein [Alcaligenes faecalis]
MPFVEGLKVTKCWIASIFFAVTSHEFLDFQHWKLGGLVPCLCDCGLQANNQPNKHADSRVLARISSSKGYTYSLCVACLFLIMAQA